MAGFVRKLVIQITYENDIGFICVPKNLCPKPKSAVGFSDTVAYCHASIINTYGTKKELKYSIFLFLSADIACRKHVCISINMVYEKSANLWKFIV